MFTPINSAQAAILAANSLALGGLLFLLSSGFSLIFGLMRIPNLMHGAFFMLGAYFGVTLLWKGVNFWIAALASAAAMAAIGGLIERLMLWTGDPWQPATPDHLRGVVQVAGLYFPVYRLVIVAVAVVIAIALWLLVDWTKLGAMIRAGV